MPDLKISQLPVASATTGAELFPVVQGGVTKQIALNAVRHIGSAVFDANGSMAVDTNTLFVDAVNNRVGVGTAAPTESLEVYRSVNAQHIVLCRNADTTTADYNTQAYFRLDVAGNTIGGLKSTAKNLAGLSTPSLFLTTAGAYPIAFGINNSATPSMLLDVPGNLGLGVTPSAASARTLQFPDGVTVSNAGTAASFAHNAVFNSGWKYVATGAATLYQKYLGAHAWFTAPSGTAGNAISFTQAMTLSASSNLTIGGTTESARVRIEGTTNLSAALQVFRSGNSCGAIWQEASAMRFGTDGSTGFTEKLRVDNTTTAGQTALLLWDVDNGTMERVTVGAADSGGTGFKVLRIPN